jgi:hypothetical protein
MNRLFSRSGVSVTTHKGGGIRAAEALGEEEGEGNDLECVSLAWSADVQALFAGYTDNKIRAWGVTSRVV